MTAARPAIRPQQEAPFRCDPPTSSWTRSRSRLMIHGPLCTLACCCPPRWPSGWGSSRPPTSWSISASGLVRPVPGASCSPWSMPWSPAPTASTTWNCCAAGRPPACSATRSWPIDGGTFLRSFTFGHVRQLDKVTGELLGRAWAAGAGPGDGPLTVDVDSTICEVHGYHKQGACYGYTRTLGDHPLLATRASSGEVLHARLRKGSANTARGILRFVDELIARLRRAGAVGELTLRMDSGFWSAKLIRRLRAHKAHYSITVRQTKTVRAAIAAIPEAAWVQIAYQPGGIGQVAEVRFKGDRLIVRRVRNLGDQQQLFATWRYHAFVTNRVGTMLELDADHRHHAVCELVIRDLKAGAGLAHLPSGQFNANAAWLLAATLAHNLLRWTASLGLGIRDQQTVAKTLRRTLLALPGRLTRSARRWRLHLPAGWPWAPTFAMALARLRCIPYPTRPQVDTPAWLVGWAPA